MECGASGWNGPSVRAVKEPRTECESVSIPRTTANPALGRDLKLDSAAQGLHVKVIRD